MVQDYNKKISKIEYNSLNLPSKLQFGEGHMVEYRYDAAGKKQSVTYTTSKTNLMVPMGSIVPPQATNVAMTLKTDYCGNMIYENGNLKMILIDGGYITFNGAAPVYHYYLQDHLGNNRVVVKANGTVEQVNHYYPFGGLMGESTGGEVQPYKYNGKELDRMHGLDWYDYGARHYDATLGRWTSMDPLAEKYYSISPYVYCINAPIRYIDPDGKKIRIAVNSQKRVLNMINSLSQGLFSVDEKGYLFMVKETNSPNFSNYYKERLNDAINNKEQTINIFIDNTFWGQDGKKHNIEEKGGGATTKINNKTVIVVISGKGYENLRDKEGKKLEDPPEYILSHELVGHAIPQISYSDKDTGDAIKNENIVRRETGKNERDESFPHPQ